MSNARVQIPGSLTAVYEGGHISGWTFIPAAGYAGYFGEAAFVTRGDEELDVEDVDGPFWKAVQVHLEINNPFQVMWEE